MNENSGRSSECWQWSGIKRPASNTASSGKGEDGRVVLEQYINKTAHSQKSELIAKTHHIKGCETCGLSYYF